LRLGDGQSVNIWSQPWIQNNPNYYITIAPPLGLEQLTVGALINHENSNWRWEMLNQFFNDHNVKAIQSIPLLNGSNKDQQF